MRIVSDKSCRQKQNTHFVFRNLENLAVYKIMWKNTVEPDRPQMAIRRMRFVCWIRKAANKHSKYVIFIAFPRQQWFRECPSVLRYTYGACPGVFCLKSEAEVNSKNVMF